MTLEEIEQKRALRRTQQDTDRKAQETVDLVAIDALEEARGDLLHLMTAASFVAGVPVKIAFRAPTAGEYKRYCDLVGRAQQKSDPIERRKVQEQMALGCMVYPPADSPARAAVLDAFPGTLISLSIECAKIAELRAEDEAKS